MPQIARPFHTLYAQHTPILLIYSRPPTHRQALPQCPTLLRTNVQILTQKPHTHTPSCSRTSMRDIHYC